MLDYNGRQIEVGDKVTYIDEGRNGACFEKGEVLEILDGGFVLIESPIHGHVQVIRTNVMVDNFKNF